MDPFGDAIQEMVLRAALRGETAVGNFVFDTPKGERFVKITVEPSEDEDDTSPPSDDLISTETKTWRSQ